MKKIITSIFIFTFLLTACGAESTPTREATSTPRARPTQTQPATATQPASSNLTVDASALEGLEISIWHPWYGVEANIFASLVKDFNKTNQWGFTVTTTGQGNFSNLYENTSAALSQKEKPDLVIALPEHALQWGADGLAIELTPYVRDPVYGLATDDIPALFLAQDEVNGGRFALPAQRNARFLLWNKTWAQELGFDSAPAAPDDFRQQACRARQSMTADAVPQNDFMGGWLVATDAMTAYAWLATFDGGVLEGQDYRFLMPNNIAAFKFLREVAEEGCSWQSQNVAPVDVFANRQALFITASLDDLPAIARAFAAVNSRDTWELLSFPGANTDALVVYGSAYVMLDTSAEKQLAAWLFIRWMLEKQQDARMVEATHLFPLRTSTLDLLGDYKKTHPQWAQAMDLLPQAAMQPQLASWGQVKVMLGDGFAHMYRVNLPSGQVAAILAEMEFTSRELGK